MVDKSAEKEHTEQEAGVAEQNPVVTQMECLYELLKCLKASMCTLHDAFSIKVEELRAENELIDRQLLQPETKSEFAARRAMLRADKQASKGPVWFEHEGVRFQSFIH